jgi:hypothetical protein
MKVERTGTIPAIPSEQVGEYGMNVITNGVLYTKMRYFINLPSTISKPRPENII